jgi:hypothetical protein
MIATVNTDLYSIFEFALVEVSFAGLTLDEDILRLHYAFLGRNSLNLFIFFTEPGHTEPSLRSTKIVV